MILEREKDKKHRRKFSVSSPWFRVRAEESAVSSRISHSPKHEKSSFHYEQPNQFRFILLLKKKFLLGIFFLHFCGAVICLLGLQKLIVVMAWFFNNVSENHYRFSWLIIHFHPLIEMRMLTSQYESLLSCRLTDCSYHRRNIIKLWKLLSCGHLAPWSDTS